MGRMGILAILLLAGAVPPERPRVIVRTHDPDGVAARHGGTVEREFSFAPGTYLMRDVDVDAVRSDPAVAWASVEQVRPLAPRLIPNDTLFPNQWHLQNTGQSGGTPGNDVNIVTAWDSTLGAGAVIAVLDDCVELTHPDLAPNASAPLSYDFLDGDPDPGPMPGDAHGTSVAGVAAARGGNAAGVSGSAPMATLVGIRMLGATTTDVTVADSFNHQNAAIAVKNCSWGPTDDGTLGFITALEEAAIQNAVTAGRGGLGTIVVFAGGNGQAAQDNVNYDNYANQRHVIAVSATTDSGAAAWYSEPGACVLVNAPSSGGAGGIVTTDVVGAAGYAAGDYTFSFGGTSSSAPLTAGVIGLMLAANPSLTWRDVRHILVRTATQNDPGHPDWTTNGAGRLVNHFYGFGRVDAAAAVAMAATWVNVPAESTVIASSAPAPAIPDNDPTGVSDSISVPNGGTVECVEVLFDATHPFRGDVEVVLTSPSGTQSRLAEQHATGAGADFPSWRFMSVRDWDESPTGAWTLTVRDLAAGNVGAWNGWTLRIHGIGVVVPPPPPAAAVTELPGSASSGKGGSSCTLGLFGAAGLSAPLWVALAFVLAAKSAFSNR